MAEEKIYDGSTISEWCECVANAYDLYYQCDLDVATSMDIDDEILSNKSFWIDLCEGFGKGLGMFFRALAPVDLLTDEEFMSKMLALDPTLMDEDED